MSSNKSILAGFRNTMARIQRVEKQEEWRGAVEFRESVVSELTAGGSDCQAPLPAAKLCPPIESSSERGSMARKRYQRGQLWLEGDRWYGRWREDVLGGVRKRVRVQEEIGTHKEYPTKRLAQRELDKRIEHVNAIAYRPRPTATFGDFAKKWEREVLRQFGESTAVNYRTHIRKHLVPFFGRHAMKDVNPELVQHFVASRGFPRRPHETSASHSRACGPRRKLGATSLITSWKALSSPVRSGGSGFSHHNNRSN